ncbi:MAG: LamG-like jellyroll fold domain-containing protein [Planctomycetota bacterium]
MSRAFDWAPVEVRHGGRSSIGVVAGPSDVYLDAGGSTGVTIECSSQSLVRETTIGHEYEANQAEAARADRRRTRTNGVCGGLAVLALLAGCSGGGEVDGIDRTGAASIGLEVTHDEPLDLDIEPTAESVNPSRAFSVRGVGDGSRWGFRVDADRDWVVLDRDGAADLAPGAESTVQVTVDRSALLALGPGDYSALVTFTPLATSGAPTASSVVHTVPVTVAEFAVRDQGRVTDGLVSLYEFDEVDGTVVHDTSGVGQAADLEIETPGQIQRRPGTLWLEGVARVASSGPATKVIDSCLATNEITLEAWVTPATANQSGPARIVSLSNGGLERNVTLGHGLWGTFPETAYNVRLRTNHGSTDLNGSPDLRTDEGAAEATLQHVVYTRASDGTSCIFVDGELEASTTVEGALVNWDPAFRFALGNEIGDNRPWFGGLHLVAVYDRALTQDEVDVNFRAGSGDPLIGYLVVDPATDFSTVGAVAGPLSAESKDYTLSNSGTSDVDWSVQHSEDWVIVDGPTGGTLAPGESTTVTMRIDTVQTGLFPAGDYAARFGFVNETNGFGSFRGAVWLTYYEPGSGSGERPGPHNTGPTFPGALSTVSSMTITQDGAVVENFDLSGTITIRANNVTIRNFRIDAGYSPYGINAGFEYSGIVIEDGEIKNVNSSCILGRGFTARRLNLHESRGDGIKSRGDVVVEGCWIHHLGSSPTSHADGNQTRGGDRLVFRGNYFDMPIPESPNGVAGYRSNAALIIQDSLATIDDFLIEGNWMNGGNYTVFVTPNSPTGITRLRIVNNRFGRDYRYGLILTGGIPTVISGNVWDDTGELIPQNNQ